MAGRGQLTEEVKQVARQAFGDPEYDLSVRELRLMPYINHVMLNNQKLDPNRVNPEEREVLKKWKAAGHMEGGATGLSITSEFWHAITDILWVSYVAYEDQS